MIDEKIIKLSDVQIKNVIAFIYSIIGVNATDDDMNYIHPEYIMEKFERYILSDVIEKESQFGMHPLLYIKFNEYCELHGLNG